MASSSGFSYGLHSVAFWRVKSGKSYGQLNPNGTLTGDTISHALDYLGDGLLVGLPQVTRKRVQFGGNVIKGTAYMGVGEISEFEIQLAPSKINLDILAASAQENTTTIIGAKISSPNHYNQTLNDVGLLVNCYFQSDDEATQGNTEFRTFIVPLCQLQVNYANVTTGDGDNPQPVSISVTADFAKYYPWGEALGADFAGGKATYFYIDSLYPYAHTAWIADGVETTYELKYSPAHTSVTSGRTGHITAINGTPTAATSIVVATGVVTVAAAGSDGNVHDTFYQMAEPTVEI